MAKDEIERLAGESSTFRRGEFSWTSGLEKKARKLYINEGLSLRAVASEIGCASSTVQQLADREGWMRSRAFVARATREWLADNSKLVKTEYVDNLLTAVEIAEKYNLNDKALATFFKKQTYKRSLSETFRKISIPKGRHRSKQQNQDAWDYYFHGTHDFSSYEEYKRLARRATAIVLVRYKHIIDPKGLNEKNAYEIDHQVSLWNGYYKVLDGEVVPRKKPIGLKRMAHPANLKLMTSMRNKLKLNRIVVNVKELKVLIERFDTKYGIVFGD